ncbi:MAG: hypothetical protein WCO11_11550 [Sphingomonadales bacterium]|jgi:hypothetical protein
MDSKDPTAWFAPKRFGYGAGLPLRWQGWALLAGFVAVLLAAQLLAPLLRFGLTVAAASVLVIVARRHTAGGWRWRTGRD